jgi:hypothetical protein
VWVYQCMYSRCTPYLIEVSSAASIVWLEPVHFSRTSVMLPNMRVSVGESVDLIHRLQVLVGGIQRT